MCRRALVAGAAATALWPAPAAAHTIGGSGGAEIELLLLGVLLVLFGISLRSILAVRCSNVRHFADCRSSARPALVFSPHTR